MTGVQTCALPISDIDGLVERLLARGARLVGEIVQYEDMYRLCYIRGPEGILMGLAEQLVKERPDVLSNP